jgi:hypothetical protein
MHRAEGRHSAPGPHVASSIAQWRTTRGRIDARMLAQPKYIGSPEAIPVTKKKGMEPG